MRQNRGFTLIELMVAIAVVATLTAIALPSYTAYVQRSKVPVALDGLSAYATRMEQYFQDTGNYAQGTGCGITPAAVANFTISCELTGTGGAGYLATATGSGPMAGYTYTITSAGVRATTAHPHGANSACWTTRGTTCDT